MKDKQRAYDKNKNYKEIVKRMIERLERDSIEAGGAKVYIRGHWHDKEGKPVNYAYKGKCRYCLGFTTVTLEVGENHPSGFVHPGKKPCSIQSWSYLDEMDKLNRAYGQYIALLRAIDVLYSHISTAQNIIQFAPEGVLENPPKEE